jgi:selT/selW/selH-like putative selenoprotein
VSLATELQGAGFDAEAIPGNRGQFDVLADGRLVFSKEETGRFPEDGEVRGALG